NDVRAADLAGPAVNMHRDLPRSLQCPGAAWYLDCPAWRGRGEVRSSTNMIRSEDVHVQVAVVGSALEAMLNALRREIWRQASLRQKASDFTQRSRPCANVDQNVTIRSWPQVRAPMLQAVEHYHQAADQAPAIGLRLRQVEQQMPDLGQCT